MLEERTGAIRNLYVGRRILLGIAHAEQMRGVRLKLKALEQLMPEWQGLLVLIQVILPVAHCKLIDTRAEQQVIELVSRLNSSYGTLGYQPVQLYQQHLDEIDYRALLGAADLCLVIPERDSTPSVVFDYGLGGPAHGQLVLSEFTAAAQMLEGAAWLVNPGDWQGTADTINAALKLDSNQAMIRKQALQTIVERYTPSNWIKHWLRQLRMAAHTFARYQPTPALDLSTVMGAYEAAQTRLLLLDYDGTLTPICKTPNAARPSPDLLRCLRFLCNDPRNLVYIVSGRSQLSLERWLGQVQGLGLSAEHGSFLKPMDQLSEASSVGWLQLVQEQGWQQHVLPILEHYTERTPGSFIEQKVASVCWHYRLADPDFGARQAANAYAHLRNLVANLGASVEIISGKRNLEIRSLQANKGTIVRQLLERHATVDFVLCLGDDRTDEDMFRQLLDHPHAFCCVVGSGTTKTLARWHLNTPEQVLSLLLRLTQLTAQRSAGTTI